MISLNLNISSLRKGLELAIVAIKNSYKNGWLNNGKKCHTCAWLHPYKYVQRKYPPITSDQTVCLVVGFRSKLTNSVRFPLELASHTAENPPWSIIPATNTKIIVPNMMKTLNKRIRSYYIKTYVKTVL